MSKFGDLIEAPHPVLLSFYSDGSQSCVAMNPVLRDLAAAMGDRARVIKINVDKNAELKDALRVKELPTLMIYKEGEMKWRQGGEQDLDTLIGLMEEYL